MFVLTKPSSRVSPRRVVPRNEETSTLQFAFRRVEAGMLFVPRPRIARTPTRVAPRPNFLRPIPRSLPASDRRNFRPSKPRTAPVRTPRGCKIQKGAVSPIPPGTDPPTLGNFFRRTDHRGRLRRTDRRGPGIDFSRPNNPRTRTLGLDSDFNPVPRKVSVCRVRGNPPEVRSAPSGRVPRLGEERPDGSPPCPLFLLCCSPPATLPPKHVYVM